MGRIRMPEGKKVACCFCFDIDALALWLGFFRFPTANSLSRGEFGPRVAMPRILNIPDKWPPSSLPDTVRSYSRKEVAKPEEYRRNLRQLIAGSPLNCLG